jgi:hypothetical protein
MGHESPSTVEAPDSVNVRLVKARKDALERAAELCDGIAMRGGGGGAAACARLIRNFKADETNIR